MLYILWNAIFLSSLPIFFPSCFLFCLCQEHTISLYLWVLGVSFYSCITLSSCPCELISQVRRLIRMTVLIGYQKNRKTFICVMCNMNTLRTNYRTYIVSITSLILHQNKWNPPPIALLLSYSTKTRETPSCIICLLVKSLNFKFVNKNPDECFEYNVQNTMSFTLQVCVQCYC